MDPLLADLRQLQPNVLVHVREQATRQSPATWMFAVTEEESSVSNSQSRFILAALLVQHSQHESIPNNGADVEACESWSPSRVGNALPAAPRGSCCRWRLVKHGETRNLLHLSEFRRLSKNVEASRWHVELFSSKLQVVIQECACVCVCVRTLLAMALKEVV